MIAETSEAGDAVKLERAAGLLMFLDTPKGIEQRPKLSYSTFQILDLTDFDQVEEFSQRRISRHKR